MPFKFDSHKFYLTYSQCGDLTWEEIAEVLRSKKALVWARFGHERHADGGFHWHVTGEWEARVQSRSERFLDVRGFHPNIQTTRNTQRCIEYCTKHGEFFDIGVVPVHQPKRTLDEALALAGSENEAEYLRACTEAKLSYQYAKRFRELAVKPKCPYTITEYELPDGVELQHGLQHAALPTNCAAVLVGPSGIGKTVWAQWICPKPALLVSNTETLKYFRPTHHRSLIFDDMDFNWMQPQQQIHLLDWHCPRTINVKHGHITIPKNTYKIFTNNYWPFLEAATAKPEHIECVAAILRRVQKIQLI